MTDRNTGRRRGIACPKCKNCGSHVLYTRAITGGRVRRRRQCCGCGKRFTTYEHITDTVSRVLDT